jgi:spore germination cell wall hydrolase CwlJ-like protein
MNKLKTGILVIALAVTAQLELGELNSQSTPSPKDVACLARNIYHEARGESVEGQIAVAQVTINRLRAGKFGSSLCKVVYAHKQFSWTLDKKKKIKDDKAWEISKAVANEVLKGKAHLPNFNALYFHTRQVSPKWRRGKQVVTTIGNHIFYT